MSVYISLATAADTNSLVVVLMKAQEANLLQRLIFNRDQTQSAETETGLAQMGLWEILNNPRARIYKATAKKGGRIVGFGSIRFQTTEIGEYLPADYVPEDMNEELATLCSNEIAALYRKHMNGQNHVVWGALYVLPEFQRKGVGSALLRWGFEHFGLARETIWVGTSMIGREIFRKYGWHDVDSMDLDLSRWKGENMGYGIHRTQLMIRKPREFESSEGEEKTGI